jgi:c-di-GMP-binding flagellar brake protein YcgR
VEYRMSMQERVPVRQLREILEPAAERLTPAALTCLLQETWQTYRSRFLGLRQDCMWLEYGHGEAAQLAPQFAAAQRIGVAFKWRNRKYVFSTLIDEVSDLDVEEQGSLRALRVAWPDEMHRLERRAFFRINVPRARPVQVRFWKGGLVAQPAAERGRGTIYEGEVIDLSAGGLSATLASPAVMALETGFVMGVELRTAGMSPLRMDAQFRHAKSESGGCTVGLQMMGLTETPAGRETLERISQLMREFLGGPRQKVAG